MAGLNKKEDDARNKEFEKIVKPEICDILISTDDYRNPWFNDENKEKYEIETIRNKIAKEKRQKLINDTNTNLVKEFKKTFFNLNNRVPMDSEIIDNLKDKIELSVLTKLIEDLKSELFETAIIVSD